jgi:hypothetical protein
MENRRVIPAALILAAAILLIVRLTKDAGGISQEVFAIVLLFCIVAFAALLVTQQEPKSEGRSSAIEGSGTSERTSESSDKTSDVVAESELPDPLDEGFDAPLS